MGNLLYYDNLPKNMRIIFIDEIQNIEGWERFIRRIHDEEYKIFITGSNANLLSSELGTHLTGRYLKVELFPFSFSEYLRYNKLNYQKLTTKVKASILKHFDSYLTTKESFWKILFFLNTKDVE